VSPAELARQIRQGRAPVVLDVRSPAEFAAGHVPGAINVPFWRFLVRAEPLPPSAGPIVMYCGHGPRARIAAGALRVRGAGPIIQMDGHWAAWQQAALPEERDPAPAGARPL
jgi:rhodanese-related sulfurtransferase